jgi:hypothetical protein
LNSALKKTSRFCGRSFFYLAGVSRSFEMKVGFLTAGGINQKEVRAGTPRSQFTINNLQLTIIERMRSARF